MNNNLEKFRMEANDFLNSQPLDGLIGRSNHHNPPHQINSQKGSC